MKICIVIPAYNEEKRIGQTLEEYGSFFRDVGLDINFLIVINNTTDKTEEIVRRYQKKYPEISYLNLIPGGKGFAITAGFKEAINKRFDLIGFLDADMSTPPSAFYDLIKNIRTLDGIIANRWDKNSIINTKQTIFRRIISRGYNLIVRTLFLIPYRDTQCGAKLFRREILEKIVPKLGSSEWSFDVDLLFYARWFGARIKEIPTIWEDKKGSKINLKRTPLKMLASSVRLRLIHSPIRDFVRLYRRLPAKFKFH